MVQYYSLFGKKVGSHYLAIGTLSLLFGGTYVSLGGGSKKTVAAPPINASTPDEADFIKKFMEEAEADAKSKAKH